jgi:hypothetical protein
VREHHPPQHRFQHRLQAQRIAASLLGSRLVVQVVKAAMPELFKSQVAHPFGQAVIKRQAFLRNRSVAVAEMVAQAKAKATRRSLVAHSALVEAAAPAVQRQQ